MRGSGEPRCSREARGRSESKPVRSSSTSLGPAKARLLGLQAGPPQECGQVRRDGCPACLGAAGAGNEHQVEARGGESALEAPVGFPHESLGSGALHGVAHAAAGHEAGLAIQLGSVQNEENLEPARVGSALAVYALEVAGSVKSLAPIEALVAILSAGPRWDHYTTSRALPLARRRFKTRRPPFVFMRERKPCFFLRRRL